MLSNDEDEVVASSDDGLYAKIWDIRDEELDDNGKNSDHFSDPGESFLLSSDDAMLPTDRVLNNIMSSNAHIGTKRRRSTDREKLWEEWHKSLKSSMEINNMTMELKSFTDKRPDVRASQRKNSPHYDRQKQIAYSIKRNIPTSLLTELAADVSDSTVDWYFLREDPDFSVVPSRYSTFLGKRLSVPLDDLYKKFGADLRANIEYTYCPYGKLIPVETMCGLIESNNSDSVQAFKHFIKFILDRKISGNLKTKWVINMWNRFTCDKLSVYFEVTPRNFYLMHYRLTRLIPIESEIVSKLFPNDNDVITEFENLLDSQEWTSLLYFIILVLGTSALPFGPSPRMTYIKDCILDLNSQNSSKIQLSIIKAYLTVCSKITQR